MQRKPLRTQGEENKPGDEEVVCVRPFPVFPSCPMLASVSLFFFIPLRLCHSLSPVVCSFFFPVLQMLYVKIKIKAKTERDDELVRLVVLLRLLFLLSSVAAAAHSVAVSFTGGRKSSAGMANDQRPWSLGFLLLYCPLASPLTSQSSP